MPLRKRPRSRRVGRPRARKTNRTKPSVPRSARTGKSRAPSPYSLSPAELKVRGDAFAAHADMLRDPKLTASQAVKDRGVSIRDLWKYIPKAFTKESSGRIRAVADRYVRRMEAPALGVIKIRGSKARNEIARFRNDVFRFLGGDLTALDKWRGVTIQGHKLVTDPEILRTLGEEDNLPEHFGSEQVTPYSGGTT
jgi:hypothetical protein